MSQSSDKESAFGLSGEQLERLFSIGYGKDQDVEEPRSSTDASDHECALSTVKGSESTLQIDGYEIIKRVAEAGQGQVWHALQQSTNRHVAIKVPKLGTITSERARIRFEREIELAARLKHPNIARIYDSGINRGQYYYVMDFVEGLKLDEYVRKHHLTHRQILELMRTICQAAQHAHQNGIIHRDLKPSNILVTDDGRPFIVDFGLAKGFLEDNQNLVISIDGETVGTPAYMSPEQAAGRLDKIDTRTDVYSLGVTLFTLLTDTNPHDLSGTRLEVMHRIAEQDVIRPRTIKRDIDREIEALLLKALDKDPNKRYSSAGGMAEDIDNYLQGKPLMASSQSNVYKLGKFVRRHAMLSAAVLAIAVTLFLGLTTTTVMYFRSERALGDAQAITDFLTKDVLRVVSDANAYEQSLIYVLDTASKKLDEGRFEERPLVEASIRNTLGWTYKQLFHLDKAEPNFDRALQIYEKQLGKEHYYAQQTRMALSFVYQAQYRWNEAYRIWTGQGRIGSKIDGITLGVLYTNLGKYQEAEACFLNKIERHYQIGRTNMPPVASKHLAAVYRLQGRYEEAEKLYVKLREALEHNPEDRGALSRAAALARVYRDQGRYREAEQLYKTTIEKQHDVWGEETAMVTMVDLAQLYTDQERYDLADEVLREVHEIVGRLKQNHPFMPRYMYNLAVLSTKQGHFSEAETLLKKVQEEYKHRLAEFADDHPEVLSVINAFGVLRREQKNYEEAESLLQQALEGRKRKLGDDHPACFESMHELAVLYKEQGDYDKAEPLLLEAVEGRRLKLGDTHPHTIESINNLIALYEAWNKPEKAEEW